MEGNARILDKIDLENGLKVYFIDRTTPPVAGRCRVELLIQVPMEPRPAHFESYPDPENALKEFISLAGSDPVAFQTTRVRNFIAAEEVPLVLEAMKEEFLRSGLQYVQKPAFAGGFLRKKYEELLREDAVRRAHEKALKGTEG